MKNTILLLMITILFVVTFSASKVPPDGAIIGRVNPPQVVIGITAIMGKDSINALPADGIFSIRAKVGTWKLIVDAKDPYKDVVLDEVNVLEGVNTDVGEILISQ